MENAYIAALLTVPGIGQERVKSLLRYFGSARTAWQADRRALFLSGVLTQTVVDSIVNQQRIIDPVTQLMAWQKRGIFTVSRSEPAYPRLLNSIYNPPELLFYRGTLPDHDKLVAIVGSRRASAYGKNAASKIAADLAEAGIWVVSGAARGIDTAAHSGALDKGNTIAVLASGVDIVYPPENAKILAQIADTGAILSEYPPGMPPAPGLFPARNRIISGLSRGVVIIEAAQKSGALITADLALEQNRDVFAVPGSIFSLLNRGTHNLIKQGAKLVDCAADILEEYKIEDTRSIKSIILGPFEEQILSVLSHDTPISLEEIMIKSKLDAANISYILLQLELQGMVNADGQRYVRTAWEGNR